MPVKQRQKATVVTLDAPAPEQETILPKVVEATEKKAAKASAQAALKARLVKKVSSCSGRAYWHDPVTGNDYRDADGRSQW